MKYILLISLFSITSNSVVSKDIHGLWTSINYICSSDGKSEPISELTTKSIKNKEFSLSVSFRNNEYTRQGHITVPNVEGNCIFTTRSKVLTNSDQKFLKLEWIENSCSQNCVDFCNKNLPMNSLGSSEFEYEIKGQILKMKRKIVGIDSTGKKSHTCSPGSYEIILFKKQK